MNYFVAHDFLYTSVEPLFGVPVIIENRDRNGKREESFHFFLLDAVCKNGLSVPDNFWFCNGQS